MKVIMDDVLPLRLKPVMEQASKIAEQMHDMIAVQVVNSFNEDKNFRDLNYSEAISYVIKIHSILFLSGINMAYKIGKHFPDAEPNAIEILDDAIKGLRILSGTKETQRTYNINDIKRI